MRIARIALGAVLLVAIAGCAHRSSQVGVREPALGLTRELSPAASQTQNGFESGVELATQREPWRFGEIDGQLITTPHYRIYTTLADQKILDRLPIFYERALDHYTTALAALPKPDVPLETYLFQNRGQWQDKTQQMLPEQAGLFSNLGRGGFTTKGTSVLYYIDRWGYTRDTFAIAAHEGWHQYTQQTFKHQLPIWLEEGVATYMEGYRNNNDGLPEFQAAANYERREALRDATRRDRLIPLDDLLTRTPQSFLNESKDKLLVYYAQVWGLLRFLSEGEEGRYKNALAEVLNDAAHGKMIGRMMTSPSAATLRRHGAGGNRVGPAVVQEYFNRDLVEFEAQYHAFIDELAAQAGPPRGRRPPQDAPKP